jgi:hypothetical protein
MKRSLRFGLAFSVVLVVLLSIGLEIASAQKYSEFKGTVVSIDKKLLAVEDSKGTTMNFVFGRKTQFSPNRRPAVGERVEIDYLMKKGASVAYQVKIKAEQ